ncbi:DMT family transporter [Olegusella massiliensis]|uniref:DMT family transporter n=1 Tax=Olegusella massiliensis TaxID=1776381 RepID=UPI0023F7F1D5|nr:DMT family transporter [Olegusella massiliensis]
MNWTKRSYRHSASALGGAVPALMVFAASIIWGSGGLFVSALEGFGLTNPEMTVVCLATALLAMSALLITRHDSLARVERANWPRFILLGTVGSFAFVLLYKYAISITGMATAAVLLYLMPSLVMMWEVMRGRERLSFGRISSLGLSLLGCSLVSGMWGGKAQLEFVGIIIGLAAALCYSLQNVLQASLVRRYPTLTVVFYNIAISAVCSVIYLLITETSLDFLAVYIAHPVALAVNIGFGLINSVLAWMLFNAAIKRMPVTQASIIATNEPVAAAVLGAVFLGQALTVFTVAGIACEVAALVLMKMTK